MSNRCSSRGPCLHSRGSRWQKLTKPYGASAGPKTGMKSLGKPAGSARAEAENASIPAIDARTSALGLMFTLNSTASTYNATAAAPEFSPGSRASAALIKAGCCSSGVTHYDPISLKEGLIHARFWDGAADAQKRALRLRQRRSHPVPGTTLKGHSVFLAAAIEHAEAAPVAAHRWRRRRSGLRGRRGGGIGAPVRPDQLMADKTLVAEGVMAQPMRRGDCAHGTDHAPGGVARVHERQQDCFQLHAAGTIGAGVDDEMCGGALLAGERKVVRKRRPVGRRPAVEQVGAPQLRPEYLAQARAGETIAIGTGIHALQQEDLGQDRADA